MHTPHAAELCRDKPVGTEQKFSARFDRESSATRLELAVSDEVGAHVSVARHAAKCAGQRRMQNVS
jgi:hypothetical protein